MWTFRFWGAFIHFKRRNGCKKRKLLIDNQEIVPRVGEDIAVINDLPTKTMLKMSYLDNLCFLLDRRLPEIWRSANVRRGVRYEYAAILGNDVFDKRIDALSETQKYDLAYPASPSRSRR